jgi:hypothetical protein
VFNGIVEAMKDNHDENDTLEKSMQMCINILSTFIDVETNGGIYNSNLQQDFPLNPEIKAIKAKITITTLLDIFYDSISVQGKDEGLLSSLILDFTEGIISYAERVSNEVRTTIHSVLVTMLSI